MFLSPFLGGISMYLLMYFMHAWAGVSVQIANAMTKDEIIMAVLTSLVGVSIVALAYRVIDMDRGHRTHAQMAATETTATETAESDNNVDTEVDAASESRSDSGYESSHSSIHNADNENDNDGDDADNEDDEDDEGEEEGDDDADNEDDEGDDDEGEEEDGEEEESTVLNTDTADADIAAVAAVDETSYENINTPQLAAKREEVSPIPIQDI